MKRKHFPAEQIVPVLKQAELGMAVGEIVRQLGISENSSAAVSKQQAERLANLALVRTGRMRCNFLLIRGRPAAQLEP